MTETTPYRDLFVSEVQEHLQLMNRCILDLERGSAGGAGVEDLRVGGAVEQLLRSAHTLKGMAASMGYGDMARLAHALEDLLDALRHGRQIPTAENIALCFSAVDALSSALDAIVAGAPTPPALEEMLHALAGASAGETGPPVVPPRGPVRLPPGGYTWAVHVTLAADCQLRSLRAHLILERLRALGQVIAADPPVEDLEAERFERRFSVAVSTTAPAEEVRRAAANVAEVAEVQVEPPSAVASAEAARAEPAGPMPQSVRLTVRQLDRLLNLVGELVISRGELSSLSAELDSARLSEALEAHGRIVAELEETVFAARQMPVSQVFDRFPRMVRDLLLGQGKDADLILEGRDVELDRTIAEHLGDILVHLLRNAVDHGLEAPEERERQGKLRRGMLRLDARRERELAVIEVTDDGRGIDPQHVAEVAVARGVVTREALADMSPAAVLMLICDPNYSTSQRVTDVSGRGVGLAAVKRQVEALRGVLEIISEPGEGSRFRMRLPVTLASVRALLVGVGPETYAVPFDYLERIRVIAPDACELSGDPASGGARLLLPEGWGMPAASLRRLLAVPEIPGSPAVTPRYALVTHHGPQPVALLVDALGGKREVVVKPLPSMLEPISGLAGATILGAGEVVLILDVPQLVARLA